ncbi:unnamed protein product [Effrenium voratum]|uniref:Uncharacterized protein n=1 Tax=Effrenium voratum TaxID=2562239 RepID=A0AA36MRN0_9DINO|nr:unnamed protein product [Effrenium voratum]CAJ1376667.1 unnamed protein product [Effrenium voratum]CAJ1454636.1 unnamed protein product [Effrenium voratum]|mmetsp:Transcript_93923/g.223471  ORF Transcript_93923/g.223471 Transcript_93923/m.223471 type:complete len:299 (+) Transcript_93923:29-925(+)
MEVAAIPQADDEDWSVANIAAFADVAAKHAQSLAQWHDHLWRQIAALQRKVDDLEGWKKKTMDDISRLRFEHKVLRRQVASAPAATKRLQDVKPVDESKQVRFAAEADQSVEENQDVEPQLASSFIATGDSQMSDCCQLEGININVATADGTPSCIAEWRIGHLSTKLRGCMGRALVSPPFSACGLQDLRLMVFPDGKEVVKGPRSRRQKELYTKKVTEGPLDGCLKLKVPQCPPPHVIEYFLYVGSVRCGPFSHNFGENTVNGCSDFGVDWLKQVDADQSLTVKVELLKVHQASQGS